MWQHLHSVASARYRYSGHLNLPGTGTQRANRRERGRDYRRNGGDGYRVSSTSRSDKWAQILIVWLIVLPCPDTLASGGETSGHKSAALDARRIASSGRVSTSSSISVSTSIPERASSPGSQLSVATRSTQEGPFLEAGRRVQPDVGHFMDSFGEKTSTKASS